jgi:hypothetical protein
VIQLPKIVDPRGHLSFIESNEHIPFDIKRVYYLYDIPAGDRRGGHAHKGLHQFIFAASGSFDVVLDDGLSSKCFHLNQPGFGLYVSPMMWRDLENFSSGAVCVVLASEKYDESDYIRDYQAFLAEANL